jgi:hypothetical protein
MTILAGGKMEREEEERERESQRARGIDKIAIAAQVTSPDRPSPA